MCKKALVSLAYIDKEMIFLLIKKRAAYATLMLISSFISTSSAVVLSAVCSNSKSLAARAIAFLFCKERFFLYKSLS